MKSLAQQIVEGKLGKQEAQKTIQQIQSLMYHTVHQYISIDELVLIPCCSSSAVINGFLDKEGGTFFFIKILKPCDPDNIWQVLAYCVLQPEKIKAVALKNMGCVAFYPKRSIVVPVEQDEAMFDGEEEDI